MSTQSRVTLSGLLQGKLSVVSFGRKLRSFLSGAASGILGVQRPIPASATSWEEADYTTATRPEEQVLDPWNPNEDTERNQRPSQTPLFTFPDSPDQSPLPPAKDLGVLAPAPDAPRNPTPLTELASHQDEIPSQDEEEDDEPAPYESDPALAVLDHDLPPPDDFGGLPEEERSNSENFQVYDEYIDVLEDPDLDVEEFTDDLHRPPTLPTTTTSQRVARSKAVQILNAIRPLPQVERADALAYLADLFEHLPHPATYKAIERLSPRLSIDIIRTMVEFREAWLDNERWHLHRYGYEIASTGSRTGGFSWKLAHRLCIARSEYPPDMMIDDDWITEWLHLKPGSVGYYSFASFIPRKLDPEDALHAALRRYATYVDSDTSSLFD